MKKITLIALVFLFGSVANAAPKVFPNGIFPMLIENADPIFFNERGIEFYVFPDGQFDFNTEASSGDTYFRKRDSGVNETYGAPANANFGGVKVEHDNQGRIRRIGNVFVNYDAQNRIKRIGSVYMTYNRFALSRIGNMEILYDRRGRIVDFVGNVKGYGNYSNGSNFYYGPASGGDNYYYRNSGTNRNLKRS